MTGVVSLAPVKPEATPAERASGLLAQAKDAAETHVCQLLRAMDLVERLASEVSTGGEIYPPGVRDLAERIAKHTRHESLTVSAIMERR